MIGPKTTFVVGAGASVPFGLPVGSDLAKTARAVKEDSPMFQLLLGQFPKRAVEDFLDDLRDHPADSIDAFLEHRQQHDDKMRIGRALISAMMGRAIAGSRLRASAERDWLAYIARKMSRDAPRAKMFTVAARAVTFITFNFDSIIEETMTRLIRAIYRHDEASEVDAAVDSIRVFHMHGKLPPPPDRPFEDPSQQRLTTRGMANLVDSAWIEWNKRACSTINVVLDPASHPDISEIHDAIEQSHILCFLGFRYEKGNLAKLGIPDRLPGDDTYQHLFGTAVGIREGERQQVSVRFNRNIQFGGESEECLSFLEHYHILRD